MNATTTVQPTTVDAWVAVGYVKAGDRHRKDLGDLKPLAASIDDIGLLNPITLTADGRLVAGRRRLEACRSLGWREIPVRFANDLTDAAAILRAERDENRCRKDMLPSELASMGAALHELEARKARARQGSRTDLTREPSGTASPEVEHRTTDAVGEILGLSGREYQELRFVHHLAADPKANVEDRELAEEALAAMDRGAGLVGEARRLRRKLHVRQIAAEAVELMPDPEPEPEPEPEPVPDPVPEGPGYSADWIPSKGDGSPRAAARRRVLIAELAATGHSSEQIGRKLDITTETIRRVARKEGITIPADRAMGRQPRAIDSNRIARETVESLEGMSVGIDLIDFDALDQDQIQDWTVSLTTSIRVLNRLLKKMKERAQ